MTKCDKNPFFFKPNSPDCYPLNYFLWDKINVKVYEVRHFNPFLNQDKLLVRIQEVWEKCANNLPVTRKAIKQFVPRLQAIVDKEGGSIKSIFCMTFNWFGYEYYMIGS